MFHTVFNCYLFATYLHTTQQLLYCLLMYNNSEVTSIHFSTRPAVVVGVFSIICKLQQIKNTQSGGAVSKQRQQRE